MKNLEILVGINSYTQKDSIIDYLVKRLKNKVEDIIIETNKENTNKSLIVGINTKLKDIEPIVLSGHIDTVPPDLEKYSTNPLTLTQQQNKFYGLGSIDMKSFIAIILDNLETIKNFSTPIIMALTTDEETDLYCVKNTIQKLKQLNIKPYFTIVGEPTNSMFNTTAKGCFEYKVEIFGKSCHSSKIENGINAINIVAKIITFIENYQKEFKDLTSNCGLITGGTIINRVPDYASIKFDVRTLNDDPQTFINGVINKINLLKQEYLGCDIKITKELDIMPLIFKNKEKITDLAKKLDVKIDNFSGGCEAGYYQAYSGDTIIFGVGDIALAHKPNEYVVLQEYKQYSKKLLKLIMLLQK